MHPSHPAYNTISQNTLHSFLQNTPVSIPLTSLRHLPIMALLHFCLAMPLISLQLSTLGVSAQAISAMTAPYSHTPASPSECIVLPPHTPPANSLSLVAFLKSTSDSHDHSTPAPPRAKAPSSGQCERGRRLRCVGRQTLAPDLSMHRLTQGGNANDLPDSRRNPIHLPCRVPGKWYCSLHLRKYLLECLRCLDWNKVPLWHTLGI